MVRGGLSQYDADQQGFGLLRQMVYNQARFWAYMDIY